MFIQSPGREPEWDSVDASNLRIFLDATTGQRMLAKLLWNQPRYGDPKDRLVESGRIEGFQDALEDLLALCEITKPAAEIPTNYPDLDAPDAVWEGITSGKA